tara:strand:+ start:230 stop:430 length:201 start_codon:yes stop_codon:yes gene_type:complete
MLEIHQVEMEVQEHLTQLQEQQQLTLVELVAVVGHVMVDPLLEELVELVVVEMGDLQMVQEILVQL